MKATVPANKSYAWLLVVGAWILSLLWFTLVSLAGWGFTPGAFVWWTVVAAPLALATERRLAAQGHPASDRAERTTAATWLVLLVGAVATFFVGDHPFWDGKEGYLVGPLLVIYAVFPIGLTAWGIAATFRARHGERRAPAV